MTEAEELQALQAATVKAKAAAAASAAGQAQADGEDASAEDENRFVERRPVHSSSVVDAPLLPAAKPAKAETPAKALRGGGKAARLPSGSPPPAAGPGGTRRGAGRGGSSAQQSRVVAVQVLGPEDCSEIDVEFILWG